MDPFHPVSAVLAVTPLAPMWQPLAGKGAAFAELQILSPCSEGEVIELRMTTRDQLAVPQHRWPYQMKILLDGKEILQLDPPETKRREVPLQLEQMEAGIVRQLQLFAWDAPMGVTPGWGKPRAFHGDSAGVWRSYLQNAGKGQTFLEKVRYKCRSKQPARRRM